MRPEGTLSDFIVPDLSRRNLFKGKLGASTLAFRPPWAETESRFIDLCSRCGDCAAKCPESLIVIGSGGYPEVDFSGAECTFCGECEAACKDKALNADSALNSNKHLPWTYKAVIKSSCLTSAGIVCRTCYEFCEPAAISFNPVIGGVSQPQLNTEQCNGCGACVSTCPTKAIEIVSPGN